MYTDKQRRKLLFDKFVNWSSRMQIHCGKLCCHVSMTQAASINVTELTPEPMLVYMSPIEQIPDDNGTVQSISHIHLPCYHFTQPLLETLNEFLDGKITKIP